jgi:hypothetical protein
MSQAKRYKWIDVEEILVERFGIHRNAKMCHSRYMVTNSVGPSISIPQSSAPVFPDRRSMNSSAFMTFMAINGVRLHTLFPEGYLPLTQNLYAIKDGI